MKVSYIKWTGDNLKEVIETVSGSIENNKQVTNLGWEEFKNIIDREGLSLETLKGWVDVPIGDYVAKSGETVMVFKQTQLE